MTRFTEEQVKTIMERNAARSVRPEPPPMKDSPGFIVFPYPISANKYWRSIGNRVLVSREGRQFKGLVKASWSMLGLPKLEGPLELYLRLHPKMNKDGTASRVCIDLGNSEKVISDALNGLAWDDDKQLVRIIMEKSYPVHKGAISLRIRQTKEAEWE
jgi:crossover junction endodeoxyribonuclease RusA